MTQQSEAPLGTVFISYRRSESADVAGRLRDRLLLGNRGWRVFKDVNSVGGGDDFPRVLAERLEQCNVVILIIGPKLASDLTRRLEGSAKRDWVRMEVVAALKLEKPLVPVMVSGASMPDPRAFPDDILDLAWLQSMPLRGDPDFDADAERLIARLGELRDSPQLGSRELPPLPDWSIGSIFRESVPLIQRQWVRLAVASVVVYLLNFLTMPGDNDDASVRLSASHIIPRLGATIAISTWLQGVTIDAARQRPIRLLNVERAFNALFVQVLSICIFLAACIACPLLPWALPLITWAGFIAIDKSAPPTITLRQAWESVRRRRWAIFLVCALWWAPSLAIALAQGLFAVAVDGPAATRSSSMVGYVDALAGVVDSIWLSVGYVLLSVAYVSEDLRRQLDRRYALDLLGL